MGSHLQTVKTTTEQLTQLIYIYISKVGEKVGQEFLVKSISR